MGLTDASGVLLVDKPSGPTSRRVTESVGRLFAPRKRRQRDGPRFRVGHAGTLDPLATGLLVVLVGRGTRLAPFLQGLDKRYLATVRFGVDTDSLDRDGEVTETADVPSQPDGLAAALAGLTGDIMQVPPVISAIKRGGRPLHQLVRRGKAPEPPPARPIRITSLTATDVRWGGPPPADDPGHLPADGRCYEVDLDVACGSGTYIRSLARDLAAALGTVGHVHALRRLEVGSFSVADAMTPDELAALADPTPRLLSLAAGLPHLPALAISADHAAQLSCGVQPASAWLDVAASDDLQLPEVFRLVTPDGSLMAVGRRDPETGEPRTTIVFPLAAADSPEDEPCG